MEREIIHKIETILDKKIIAVRAIGGGCINEAQAITTENGIKYFLKFNFSNKGDMFLKEANGLRELQKPGVIRIPNVIAVNNDFLLLEMIEAGNRSNNFWEEFGKKFARLHRHSGSGYGFYEDNYIGSTKQANIPTGTEKQDWCEFYFNKRLFFQFKLAEKNGYVDSGFRSAFGKLEQKISEIIDVESGSSSLLHGDLWNGNFIIDPDGNACLIDPAVYYGNREADLAMTKLFGGFDSLFYEAYNEEFPLDDGYDYRQNIYKLYHVLNHLNLFGTSYFGQALNLIKYYL